MCGLLLFFSMKSLLSILCCLLVASTALAQYRKPSQPSQTTYALAQQAQVLREIQYALQSLEERISVIDQQQQALAQRMTALERDGNSATKDELAALRADLNAVKNEQGKMRGEIVSDLTSKIKTIADKQRADAVAAEKAAKAAQKSGYTHIVEAGQTISAIAQAYKVSSASILKANKIKDPTKIRVGQELFIPDP